MSPAPVTRRALIGGALAAGLGVAGAARAPRAAAAESASVVATTWRSPRELTATLTSPAMNREVAVRVLLPASYPWATSRRYPVLYLLHGSYDNHDAWLDKYGARPVLDGAELITVMPDGGSGGWYSNHAHSTVGRVDWETFHTEHLVQAVDSGLRTLPWRDARAVAGFSMGGFGAALYAGHRPDLFRAVSTFSGATNGYDMRWRNAMANGPGRDGENYAAIFGTAPGSEDGGELWWRDPCQFASRLVDHRVRLYAGTDQNDSLEMAVRSSSWTYHEHLARAGARDLAWTDINGGHTWDTAAASLRADLPGLLATLTAPQTW